MTDNKHRGSTLDSFLEQEGTLAEFQAQAIKEVIASQHSVTLNLFQGLNGSPKPPPPKK